MINYLVLFSAITLSIAAAYYSIVGLTLIFTAAVIPVMIMGSALEFAKVVSVSWLYRNWKICPAAIRYYLIAAISVLMLITSMGTFGFLSRAHSDQTALSGDTLVELKLIEQQIESEQRRVENAQKSLNSLDRLVAESDTESAIKLRKGQERERKQISSEISTAASTIKELNSKAQPLRKESIKQTAEIGPIKYIADLLYGDNSQADLDSAVKWVIVLLVLVFDPLAVTLLIAANIGIAKSKTKIKLPKIPKFPVEKINSWKKNKKDGIIEIDSESLMNIK